MGMCCSSILIYPSLSQKKEQQCSYYNGLSISCILITHYFFFLDKSMWAYSGHYKPSVENLSNFMTFLQENGVDLKEVEVRHYKFIIVSN
jgi:hypothetical protein